MDALMAALVAAALAQIGNRTAWLAAILADRFRAPVIVVTMAALALLAASGLATTAGDSLGPMIAPRARQLLLGVALIMQGGGALFRVRAPERLTGWRIGPAATSLLALFILAFGDGLQFIVLALAARAQVPALVAVGATVGSLVVVIPAVVMGEDTWVRLRLRPIRIVCGMLFVMIGAVIGLDAAALI